MLFCFRLTRLTSFIRAFFYVVASALGAYISDSRADDSTRLNSLVRLSIRTIQASDPREPSGHNSSSVVSHIDTALGDLESKLARLPFAKFHLIALKEETITLRKKNWIQLPNGQSLAFRPMYVENKKVGLWLNWKDRDGTEILNTRLHFDANDSVLTGTDGPHDQGLILAIKAVAEDGKHGNEGE